MMPVVNPRWRSEARSHLLGGQSHPRLIVAALYRMRLSDQNSATVAEYVVGYTFSTCLSLGTSPSGSLDTPVLFQEPVFFYRHVARSGNSSRA